MTKVILLTLNCIALTGYAFFLQSKFQPEVFTILLLLLPFLENNWNITDVNFYQQKFRIGIVALFSIFVSLSVYSGNLEILIATLIFVAIPEEWFFRAYLLNRLSLSMQHAFLANIITSMFFALLHLPVQGLPGLLVFFPSLIFGWIYLRYKDLMLTVMLHGVSNYLFIQYFNQYSL